MVWFPSVHRGVSNVLVVSFHHGFCFIAVMYGFFVVTEQARKIEEERRTKT